MAWTDITREFYEEFGPYYVCTRWNGETGGRFSAAFLTNQQANMREYVLTTIWPDHAMFFTDAEAARDALEHEKSLRPGLYDEWRVLKLDELATEFGHAPHPAIALIGGKSPQHPVMLPELPTGRPIPP